MANIWRDPIFDRTGYDVAFAIQKIAEWKKNHTHSADVAVDNNRMVINEGSVSTNEDSVVLQTDGTTYVEDDILFVELGKVYDLKGCLNLSDIIRIEDNISFLAEQLEQNCYPVVVDCRGWVQTDLPNINDMKRIASNIRSLFSGFVTPSEYSPIPETMLSYHDINAIERNLYLLKEMLDVMRGLFIKSGTTKCGATMRLPIRR